MYPDDRCLRGPRWSVARLGYLSRCVLASPSRRGMLPTGIIYAPIIDEVSCKGTQTASSRLVIYMRLFIVPPPFRTPTRAAPPAPIPLPCRHNKSMSLERRGTKRGKVGVWVGCIFKFACSETTAVRCFFFFPSSFPLVARTV